MYIFNRNDYVIYRGDYSTVDETRRKPSLAIVDNIDENKFPYVGLKLLPNEELMGVHASLVININTSEKYLEKLGFTTVEEPNGARHYTLGHVIIGGIVLYPAQNHIYSAGYRLFPSKPYTIEVDKIMMNGWVNEEELENALPCMHNMNTLVTFLQQQGLTNKTIPEIFELDPYY